MCTSSIAFGNAIPVANIICIVSGVMVIVAVVGAIWGGGILIAIVLLPIRFRNLPIAGNVKYESVGAGVSFLNTSAAAVVASTGRTSVFPDLVVD